jgi:hypothetical protein
MNPVRIISDGYALADRLRERRKVAGLFHSLDG